MSKDTIYLPLKAKWYDMVERGEKTEEYRDITFYWQKRICGKGEHIECGCCKHHDCKHIKYVRFQYGYTRRWMTFIMKTVRVGRGKVEWGASEDRDVFIIELGEKIN